MLAVPIIPGSTYQLTTEDARSCSGVVAELSCGGYRAGTAVRSAYSFAGDVATARPAASRAGRSTAYVPAAILDSGDAVAAYVHSFLLFLCLLTHHEKLRGREKFRAGTTSHRPPHMFAGGF